MRRGRKWSGCPLFCTFSGDFFWNLCINKTSALQVWHNVQSNTFLLLLISAVSWFYLVAGLWQWVTDQTVKRYATSIISSAFWIFCPDLKLVHSPWGEAKGMPVSFYPVSSASVFVWTHFRSTWLPVSTLEKLRFHGTCSSSETAMGKISASLSKI